jgi:hypothetical protein
LNCSRKKFGPNFKELWNFLPKKLSLSSQKYEFGIRDPGSEIRDPGSGINLFRIPDPGVKKAQSRIPDPGSGSATLGYSQPQSRQSAKLFLQSSELGLPHPLPQASVPPPTLWFRGEGTLACQRRVGGVPIPTRGHTLWYSVNISTLCSQRTPLSGLLLRTKTCDS